MGAFALPTGSYLIRRGRRLRAASPPDFSALLSSKPPVLYLRAFHMKDTSSLSASSLSTGLTRRASTRGCRGMTRRLGSPSKSTFPMPWRRTSGRSSLSAVCRTILRPKAPCAFTPRTRTGWRISTNWPGIRRAFSWKWGSPITRPLTEGSAFAWAFWSLLWRLRGIRSVRRQEFARDLGSWATISALRTRDRVP